MSNPFIERVHELADTCEKRNEKISETLSEKIQDRLDRTYLRDDELDVISVIEYERACERLESITEWS